MAQEIPAHVRRFIARHIDSISALDVLLLLRAAPDKAWAPADVARALVSSETAATGQLDHLCAHRLVAAEESAFRYAPSGEDGRVIDELAECYARRRNAVIGVIFGSDERQAIALADAFRFKKDKP
jgi:hypothetical protein